MGNRVKPGPRRRRPRILIAGLGNELLRDDGVGIHAVKAIKAEKLGGVKVAEVGTAVLDALDLIEWADMIIGIDAMEAGGVPGTVYTFGLDDVAEAKVRNSLHEVNLQAALRFLPGHKAPRIAMIGVEPESIDYSLELSPSVEASLPTVTKAASQIVKRWQDEYVAQTRRSAGKPLKEMVTA